MRKSRFNEQKIIGVLKEVDAVRRRQARRRQPRSDSASTDANESALVDGLHGRHAGNGRTFRLFNIVDDFRRECLVSDAETSLPGTRVVRALDELAEVRGLPETIVIDNWPEFTSRAFDEAGCAWIRCRRCSPAPALSTCGGHVAGAISHAP